MSSYIVDNTTIDRIITGIKQAKLTQELEEFYNSDDTAFGQMLIDMNISGVDQRYSEKNDPIEYKYKTVIVTEIQALKSINCLLYQCYEGNVPSTKLYKIMREVTGRMALHIIESLPSYDKAEWA